MLARPVAAVALSFAVMACGSSPSSSSSTSASSTGGSGGGGGSSSSSTSSVGTEGTGGGSDACSSSGKGKATACSDVGTTDCFSSYDCAAGDRCEDQGTADAPVPCCVPGARGKGASGAPCTCDDECNSGICVETDSGFACSDKCASANDCPASLPECIPVAFSGSDDTFCLP